ncbi:restriction endonuclease subunit S [Staphylococcus pseudintermedius]|uniref:restriction endonuclease subunit S n=1 Tax=Staphylococcus pseudintermedius TaxID=283734 RepID=UPI000F6CE999|nr:restriction endonuclease subunit S [Staphylococcus pseudintermedius]MDK3742299.1 restriction endonuclease subunit S [Staphylococcus pseudintermedius]VED68164.1 type I restriction-modification system specificity protein [Staphylococcus pseudintermedius]
MTEIANTPELRFPNYENSWFSYKLNDISERVTRKNKNLESQRPLTISGQLGLIDQIEYFNKSVSSKNLTGYTLIKKGEFAYNKSYSNGYPLGAIKKLERYDLGILSSLYICFSFDENIDKSFMKNYFESTKWYREVANIAVEGARNHGLLNIPVNDFFNININLPIQYEQEKIGEFFSKLDRQIELEEEKLELLEQQKRGYMQKIFLQELRFKDENGNEYPEWEDKKLLNVIAIQNGYAFKSNLFSEKGMPIIRITDINKSTVKKGTVYYPESIEINERFKIKQYDILIAMSGATTGKVGKYISEKPSLLNQRIGKFVMKKGTDNNFMFTYLNSLYFKKELSKLLVAGAQPNISSQDIENINLFIPINEEQRKIGEFFNELDELIEKQSSKIGVLKQRKKGFLQKMFV